LAAPEQQQPTLAGARNSSTTCSRIALHEHGEGGNAGVEPDQRHAGPDQRRLSNGFLIYTNIGTNRGSHNTLTNLDDGNTNLSPTNHLVIAINTNSGVVIVTFQPTGMKTNIVAHGAVLQNQTDAAGYFLGTNESGAFVLGPP
jgi:hypothetical protein